MPLFGYLTYINKSCLLIISLIWQDEIVAVETNNPSLSQFDVVENCFGTHDRGTMVCFGFGVKPKDVRGPLPSRNDLTAGLHVKQKENDDLQK